MEEGNNYDPATSNLKTNILSEKEKKITIYSIAFLTGLILLLLGLIGEAYVNQHPVLEFLQYSRFKFGKEILGSISLFTTYIGIILFCIAQYLFIMNELQWKKILLLPTTISLLIVLIYFRILFTTYDWKLEYSEYKYASFVLIVVSVLGLTSKTTLKNSNSTLSHNDNKTWKVTFSMLLILGFLLNAVAF